MTANAKTQELVIVTNGSGAGSAVTHRFRGPLVGIDYIKPGSGGYENNVTLSVAGQRTGKVYLALAAAAMDASVSKRPQEPTHLAADGTAALYADTGKPVLADMFVNERLILTVAAGGSAKTGTFRVRIGN